MSIKFYKTILLVVFCLSFISPINLQAYCQFEGCGGSSNLDEAPLTLQEAQEIKEFYTSVERALSENLEVLSDGTYQVTFPQNINVLLGTGMAVVAGDHGGWPNKVKTPSRSDSDIRISNERWETNNRVLRDFFRNRPHTSIKGDGFLRGGFLGMTEMTINIDDPRGKYALLIKRTRSDGWEYNKVFFYRKFDRNWVASPTYWTFDLGYWEKDRRAGRNYLNNLVNSLQSDDPQDFENYLRARRIKWTGEVFARKMIKAGRFVGRWTFRAVLAGASIVGGQMLFEYAQENHPEETKLVIAITKEQWEKLVTNVRGIIEELSENNVLNELEL